MFFDLFETPVSFQDYVNKIMAKKLDIFVIMYLNNIFIYIKDLSQSYIKIVESLLDILQKYRFFANF